MINRKQCTIVWHVDDSKISHAEPEVVTSVIGMIEERFKEVTISRGKPHTFLGMDIELRDDGTVFLGMQEYLEEIILAFGEEITAKAPIPAKIDNQLRSLCPYGVHKYLETMEYFPILRLAPASHEFSFLSDPLYLVHICGWTS